ncbi:MAG: Eco57I restriction-modification methylase domain-containing protein [Planctomycetota bacterium]|nr:Eco57I restriction-modification methylase domain-containing protein [Planctomycetota bacterium]
MVAPQEIHSALGRVKDQASFLQGFLRDTLRWPVERGVERCDDIAYQWTAQELQAEGLDERLVDGQVLQLQPFTDSQPWGVVLLEFKEPYVLTAGRGMTGPLRRVLRGLVPKRRASANQATQKKWARENLLFISTHQYRHFRFSYFKAPLEAGRAAPLASFGWNEGDTHIRTLCEHHLPPLAFPDDGGADVQAWLRDWSEAFSVEKVTKEFFRQYHEVFEAMEERTKGVPSGEPRRLYTQRLLNRLMFAYFIQKKGWLEFDGRKDYLRALFERAQAGKEDFLNERLYDAFFCGFNTHDTKLSAKQEEQLVARRGRIPFLNGGLFEMDDDGYDVQGKVRIPNNAFAGILDLFERYNFTISESTPLDIEVAVDPEMLGKVFEELVTGRHESGSYYTPRPIVSFMCREALKGYLGRFEKDEAAVARFVDHDDPSGLHNPAGILQALKDVKVCDPACGSGAYLLGMMHELLRLRAALFKSDAKLDPKSMYERKLEIIENNLYGVDLDPFAVNIAMLRLWLSLVIEYEGDTPPPLPNLDFKIGCGDSLTAPDPLAEGATNMFVQRRDELADQIIGLKRQYMNAHDYQKKQELRKKITQAENDLAELAEGGTLPENAFDWRVKFAEVFAPRGGTEATLDGKFGFIADMKPQREFTQTLGKEPGGFDIVLANPPYIRAEIVKQQMGDAYKQHLCAVYPEAYVKTADLYVAFFARAHQLLRRGGAACFISSNKWLRAGYGEKLRQHLLDEQAFSLVVDFGELPIFESAATFPAVFLWQKQPRGTVPTTWVVVKDLDGCYADGVREHLRRIATVVPAAQFEKGRARLATSGAAGRQGVMNESGPRLGELLQGRIYWGIKTGLNEAFYVNREARDQLVAEGKRNADIIRPLLVGDDVRRYEAHYRETYLLWTYIGVPIKEYPAVLQHLKRFQRAAEERQDQGQHWWELRPCDYYDIFDRPKIIYPEIGKVNRFFLDTGGYLTNNKSFILPTGDWYLLGVLNSRSVFEYLMGKCSVLGDESQGGRLEYRTIYMEELPIPDAGARDRERIGAMAKEAQALHTQRRKRVEKFLRGIGLDPAQSSSRNPLEEPWTMTEAEFLKRARKYDNPDPRLFAAARDDTAALTEQALKIEREIDERVAGLYGLDQKQIPIVEDASR